LHNYPAVLIGYSKTPQIHPQNCAFPFDDHHPCNTPIIRPTPLTIPNNIRIHSAVLPHYTFRQTHTHAHRHTHTDARTQTDRWAKRHVSKTSNYARCTDTQRLANNVIGTPIRYTIACMWRVCRQSVQWRYHWNFFRSIVEGESLVRYAT